MKSLGLLLYSQVVEEERLELKLELTSLRSALVACASDEECDHDDDDDDEIGF